MIVINELTLTKTGDKLTLEVSIPSGDMYTNVYFDQIRMDTQDTFVKPEGASDKSKIIITVGPSAGNPNGKHIKVVLNPTEFGVNFNSNILFIYVYLRVEALEDLEVIEVIEEPSIILIPVINTYPIYLRTLEYMKEVNSHYTPPKGFIDMVLRYKALELSLKTKNYYSTINFWNKFFIDGDAIINSYK